MVRTGFSFGFFSFCALILREFLIVTFYILPSCPYDSSHVAWVDDETASLVLDCLTHPPEVGHG